MYKKLLFILFLSSILIKAQVIISPFVVYIDEKDKFGSYVVQNESNQEYEVSIFFKFGYPVTDSLGNGTMKYYDEIPDSLPSIVKWIKAFPKKFVLPPKERQVIRMTVRPPETLAAGTYWARIVTSSVPRAKNADSQTTGVSAKINFVVNQVTTALYRKEPAETAIALDSLFVLKDSSNIHVMSSLKRLGNTPFFGDMTVKLFDSDSNLVDTKEEYVTLYVDMLKKTSFRADTLRAGKYFADFELMHNEKDDIPGSRLNNVKPISKSVNIEIP